MTIQTERLTLRPLALRDLKTTFAYASDPEHTQYMLHLPVHKKRQTKLWLKYVQKQWKVKPPERYEFAVLLDGRHIGAVGLGIKDEARQSGEMGWIIDQAYQGRGYVTEAARAVLGFARDELGLKHVYARCDYRNVASTRIMEKLGMALEDDTRTRRYNDSDEEIRELRYSITF